MPPREPREKEGAAPKVPAPSSRFSKKNLLIGGALLLSIGASAVLGSIIAIYSTPKISPQVAEEELEEDEMPAEDFSPVRGIDLAREKDLPSGQAGILPMEYALSKRGMATEHLLFDILDPEVERELHRPMVPRLIAATSLERGASDVSVSLAKAGGLGDFEPMIDRPMPAQVSGKSEPTFPETTERSEPRVPPSDVVASFSSTVFPSSRYNGAGILPRAQEDIAGVEVISPFRD